jgi:hypothetical protein
VGRQDFKCTIHSAVINFKSQNTGITVCSAERQAGGIPAIRLTNDAQIDFYEAGFPLVMNVSPTHARVSPNSNAIEIKVNSVKMLQRLLKSATFLR